MGTDIHLYVERRENGQWLACDKWRDDEYEPGTLCVDYRDSFYHDRNYSLFAMLADVRNGRGFAGVKTGEGFNPINEPRGWPGDCSPELKAHERYVDHTPSWLLVSELLAYDWTQTTKLCGYVTVGEFLRARYYW